MNKLAVLTLLALVPLTAAAQSPQENYNKAYRILREAKRAEYMKSTDLAWRRYGEARRLLEGLQESAPGWNRDGVAAQLRVCANGAARTAPPLIMEASQALGGTRILAGEMGRMHGRKVAFRKQFQWERRKLDEIEELMVEFREQERVRSVLGLEKGVTITQAHREIAENPNKRGSRIVDDVVQVAGPETLDTDSDGLTDAQEEALGTAPDKADSDADGLTDGEEVNTYKTDPLNQDTDGDGDNDGYEVENDWDPLVPKFT